MDTFVDDYKSKNGTKSKHTEQTLKTSIKRIEKATDTKFDNWTLDTFKSASEILDKMLDSYTLNTIILTFLAIIRYLEYKKAPEGKLTDFRDTLNELVAERQGEEYKQEGGAAEMSNWIPYEQLRQKVLDKAPDYLVKQKAYTDYRNFLILALYTLQPPTRIGNYLDMRVKDQTRLKKEIDKLPAKYNYVYNTGTAEAPKYKFIFNTYKTAKYIGKVSHTVEDETLNKLLNKWLTKYNIKIDAPFLQNANGKTFTQSNFTNAQNSITKKILDKELTTNDFRHIYLTWFLSRNPSIEEKQKIAQIIGQKYKPSRMELYERRDAPAV